MLPCYTEIPTNISMVSGIPKQQQKKTHSGEYKFFALAKKAHRFWYKNQIQSMLQRYNEKRKDKKNNEQKEDRGIVPTIVSHNANDENKQGENGKRISRLRIRMKSSWVSIDPIKTIDCSMFKTIHFHNICLVFISHYIIFHKELTLFPPNRPFDYSTVSMQKQNEQQQKENR